MCGSLSKPRSSGFASKNEQLTGESVSNVARPRARATERGVTQSMNAVPVRSAHGDRMANTPPVPAELGRKPHEQVRRRSADWSPV
jgi:hypothetical protein